MTEQDPLLQQPSYAKPRLVADVVMKGGITSGIVYPRAVARLAQTYRLQNVGGTSAGAIAAAAAAAAEHGRGTRRGGFAALAAVPAQLAEGKPGDLKLLRLFQPDERTSRLFRLALAVLAHGKRGAVRALWLFPRFSLSALLLAAVAIVLAALGEIGVGYALAVCIAALVVAVAGTAVNVIRDALTAIPNNDYGLCRLFTESPVRGREPLTVWLHQQLQTLSGKGDVPLTFGDLWGDAGDAGWDAGSRNVNLEVITTDLTHGRPLRLPVPFQPRTTRPREAAGLLFDPVELGRFFPASVVHHMESCDQPEGDERATRLAQINPTRRLCPMPLGADLPVLVAARMSLSFPVLISAVPLWELDFDPKASRPIKRVLFSDGGISSNFPVHFFDAILPRRPTFGISLTSFPPGQEPDPQDQMRNIVPPPKVAGRVTEQFREIDGMLGFATAIKDAAQNWRDNAQALIPGFRERIAHVKLDRNEGGLNLGMDQTKLAALAQRGECAGEMLAERFDQPGGRPYSNWNRYRFARYRTGMALIERVLRSANEGLRHRASGTAGYDALIAAGTDEDLSYRFESRAELEFAEETTGLYEALVAQWGARTLADSHVPKPEPDLRIVPPA